MSDDARPGRDPAEPAHQDVVRRLLAEARHDEPLPPEVAARLDTLLGELVEARARDSGVHSLAHRRRQRGRLLLVAAAAAVAVGVAVPQLTGSSGSDTTASDSAASAPRASAESAPAQDAAGAQAAPNPAAGGVVILGAATFEADVARVAGAGRGSGASSSDLSLTGVACGSGDYGAGRLLPAVYDGTPAVLALRAPGGGVRRIDLLACGSAEVLRSTTVPTT